MKKSLVETALDNRRISDRCWCISYRRVFLHHISFGGFWSLQVRLLLSRFGVTGLGSHTCKSDIHSELCYAIYESASVFPER